MNKLLVAMILLGSCKCTEDRTRQVLLDSSYSGVTIEGTGWRACGEDPYCTRFFAIGPSGRPVRGAVGCGIGCGKGCTIRLD